jgi:hypothetical protein
MLKEDDEAKDEHGEDNHPDDQPEQEFHRKNSGPIEKPRRIDSPGAIL